MSDNYTVISQFNDTLSQPNIIIGVDEVGRGCLFGHMSVCAVVLPSHLSCFLIDDTGVMINTFDDEFNFLNDSKKLTTKKRQQLYHSICRIASFVIVDISHKLIDELNIYHATLLGMKLAIEKLTTHIHADSVQILIDGNALPNIDKNLIASPYIDIQTLVKGDSRHASIACASILAKVHRDTQMDELDSIYPNYSIGKHKGYPTKAHIDAIRQHGILPQHRKSYAPIKQLLINNPPI